MFWRNKRKSIFRECLPILDFLRKSLLRTRFWVPRGRQIVKRILGECVTCRKLTGKPDSAPPTAALPGFRVREAPPFSRVGVDFAGPLYVKQKSGEMDKAYIALFSCCVTRAVRLELVEDCPLPHLGDVCEDLLLEMGLQR